MRVFILIVVEALTVMEQEIQFLHPGAPGYSPKSSVRAHTWVVFTVSRNKTKKLCF